MSGSGSHFRSQTGDLINKESSGLLTYTSYFMENESKPLTNGAATSYPAREYINHSGRGGPTIQFWENMTRFIGGVQSLTITRIDTYGAFEWRKTKGELSARPVSSSLRYNSNFVHGLPLAQANKQLDIFD